MRKYITIISAFVLLGLAFISAKALVEAKKPAMRPKAHTQPLAFVKKVKNQDLPVIVPASGSLKAKNKIKLYSEVQGVLEMPDKEFKPGVHYKKGEILVQLNSTEFYTQVMALKSSFYNQVLAVIPDIRLDFPDSFDAWQKYITAFDLTQSIQPLPEPTSEKEKLFVASKNLYNTYYSIKNLEVKLGKYTIRAPFDGVLTEANITPGTLVSPGQAIGEFINPDIYELELAVNSSILNRIEVGDQVVAHKFELDNTTWNGTITRINGKVDKSSQTVNVYVDLKGKGLHEGLYLKADITSRVADNILEIPGNLLVNKSNIYVVNDSILSLKPIQIVYQNEKTVMVRGLQDGQEILSKPIPKAFDGMKVRIYKEEKQAS